ncbi:citrate synthase-lysine N-methyltransferase CSKMT, mitochondrial isoform X2 [Myxocyprinus asiaticus]|uniref:citrate synthase-lysine N-methyltransferase CSKMT, mitochondrial isoform X2 n=1 Tax=Myxocyprinus asiaticus TaxID=70543 RepID=UPI0022225547|nr:citrate synthase-lysine N-methyltransferase CSKMT, mitochondrial isoform X2 [Myxocyprinus asiaticus]
MWLMNRFAVSLRTLQKLTGACRWHHTSLTNELIENMDKKATWDRFYTENASKGNFKNFEWFFGFHSVQDFILPVLQTMSHSHSGPLHILDMGCGTSALGPCIYRNSPCPVKVTCADISPVAVQLLEEHTKTTPAEPQNPSSALAFLELDCTLLKGHFGTRNLDLILDKGTTDALVRSKEGRVKAGQIVQQCLQVLRPSGSLLQFSDEDPDARLVWLETEVRTAKLAADVGVQEVGELRGVSYFCYQITPRIAPHLQI